MASSFLDLLTQNQPSLQTKQALLVLGLQTDFVSPNGKLPVDTSTGFLERIQKLVPVFRENAGDVIWVQTVFRKDQLVNDASGEGDTVILDPPESLDDSSDESDGDAVSKDTSSISSSRVKTNRHKQRALELLKKVSSRRRMTPDSSVAPAEEDETFLTGSSVRSVCCCPDTDGVKFPPAVQSWIDTSTDRIVQKSSYSAFNSTSLLINLRAKLVTELYICGCMTNISVFATALDAARHGIAINIVDDCLGYRKAARHEEALRQMNDMMGANLISSQEIIAALTAPIETDTPRTPKTPKKSDVSEEDVDLQNLVDNLRIDENPTTSPADKFRKKASLAALRLAARNIGSPSKQDSPEPLPKSSNRSTRGESVASSKSQASPLALSPKVSQSPKIKDESSPGLVKSKIKMRHRSKRPEEEKKREDRSEKVDDTKRDARNETRPTSSKSNKPTKDKSRPTSVAESSEPVNPNVLKSKDKGKETLTQRASRKFPSLKLTKSQPQLASTPEARPVKTPDTPTRPKSFALSPTPKNTAEEQNKRRPHSLSIMSSSKKPQSLATFPTLGPKDRIAEGDSKIIHNFFPDDCKLNGRSPTLVKDEIFSLLYQEVKWQKMYHAQGEVPRLVCAQGDFGKDGSMPIYRHPSDTALPLLHFSPAVQMIRERVQALVKHPTNHVLIQLYRSGNDHISEHSDKTLDVVRGSSIVNVSFGAQRTMRLRTKRTGKTETDTTESTRNTQRVPMPHNSMFVLGLDSNQRWLHGIQPDKRMAEDRNEAEKAYSGMRISLTFRHIGTFIDGGSRLIWGQGATTKDKEEAIEVINDDEKKTEEIIHAFGKENQSAEFDWNAVYGGGFDVLHFRKPPADIPIFFESNNSVENAQVATCLAELGIEHTTCMAPPKLEVKTNRSLEIGYRDSDARHTETRGVAPILLYLDRYHQFDRSEQGKPATATAYQIILMIVQLQKIVPDLKDTSDIPESALNILDELDNLNDLHGADYIAGHRLTIADCATWPVLDAIIGNWSGWNSEEFPRLSAYYKRLWATKKSFGKLRDTLPKHV